ncbi:MAG TPA: aminopeptidase P N-terminal domain-containing protein [Candidatus Saccharimonadales bacterium]|nr:aminopeptidase P N-terminal domain-containing protein [Candidatus Saccharimonadales bacterium]
MELPTLFFVNNRAKLRQLFRGTAPIVLSANSLIQSSGDMTYRFRQDANFFYFTGLDISGAVLVIDKDREYLILEPKTKYTDIEIGVIENKDLSQRSGIAEILTSDEGWRKLSGRLKRAKHAATIPAPPGFIAELGFFTNPGRAKVLARIKEINSEIEFLDLTPHVIKIRSIKQAIELDSIKTAIKITETALTQVKRRLKSLNSENEIEAMILSSFRSQNAWPSFDTVVASGKNACAIHYTQNSQLLGDQQLVVIDVGAEVNRYAADITRTFSIGLPKKRQKQVYQAVVSVSEYATSLLKPGVILKDYEKQVADFMGEQLRVLGLIKTIDDKSVRKYFPHLTSHFLGLESHDLGDYSQPLKTGMVITVEPGVYIPEEEIGVRLENDILITDTGHTNLSTSLPLSLG